MARGINKVILVGNLGADPETRYSTAGAAIVTIRIATSDSWRDKQTGEQQERTEWHRVKFFGRLAEIAGEYLRKGSQVYIEGALRTDKYTGQDGVERYTTDIIANEMQMLGGRGGGEGGARPSRGSNEGYGSRGGAEAGGGRAPREADPFESQSGAGYSAPRAAAPSSPQSAPMDDFDDDSLPF
ncbi:MAG TPA: single-stranded DNA-binding protein [Chiayiivirga sp.]|nr:single-stranded DNA-binding protein [Chiayiivirga sp.]